MHQTQRKVILSAALVVLMAAAMASVGTTDTEGDEIQGMMIDFGYWDADWVEASFPEGTDGYEALGIVCDIRGYERVFLPDGSLYSIDRQSNLVNATWGMYVLDGNGDWVAADPLAVDASEHRVLCFARSAGASTVIPGTDGTGFTYYGYASGGLSKETGKDLRIVCLAPSVTETLVAVGGLDYIIGTDLYSDYPSEIVDGHNDGSIAVTGGYTDPNYEYIVKLAPDIVFCDGGTGEHVSMADKLRKSGIDCVVLRNCTDIGVLYDNMWIAANALGLPENASDAINSSRNTVDAVSGIAGMTNKRVFAALSADPSPWTAGSNTFISDIITVSGGLNIFDSQSSSWFMVNKEQIYMKQPQVIIILSASEVSTEEEYQSILDSLDPLWKDTPAFRNGDVYVFSGDAGDTMQRPGPRLTEAVEMLCKVLNPEAFTQKDPMDVIPKYFDDSYHDYLRYQADAEAIP